MWQYLMHLWAPPPAALPLICPAPAPGEPADPGGFFDPAPLSAAYDWIFTATAAGVLLMVLVCYLAAPASLSLHFVRRWYGFWIGTALLGALVPLVVLLLMPQHALAGSCETNPLPFAAALSLSQMLPRITAGLAWAFLAFPLLSRILTWVAGRHPASRGFFHNRGCPWPRWNPLGA
jgi:hypothetical protein